MYEKSNGETTTKLEIAKRELTEAIMLFLEERDPVAYYLLAFASNEIIRNVSKPKGVLSIKDHFADMVNEDAFDKVLVERFGNKYKNRKRKRIKDKIQYFFDYDYNNIKHGGNDAEEEVTTHWGIAVYVMFDSVSMLRDLGETLIIEHIALMVWIKNVAPEVYSGEAMINALESFEKSIGLITKKELVRFVKYSKDSGLKDFLTQQRIGGND